MVVAVALELFGQITDIQKAGEMGEIGLLLLLMPATAAAAAARFVFLFAFVIFFGLFDLSVRSLYDYIYIYILYIWCCNEVLGCVAINFH